MPRPSYYLYVEFKTGGGKMYEVDSKKELNEVMACLNIESLSSMKIISGFTLETRVSEDD